MTETEKLYQQLLEPSNALLQDMNTLDGDIMILGAGGKMGPDLAVLAQRASQLTGKHRRILAVSRFTDRDVVNRLEAAGVTVIQADLLDRKQLNALPLAPNLLYLAGTKFGTTGREHFTWAMNSFLPGLVAEKFHASRIVAFSTGNVYPLVPVFSGGATENDTPGPVGEYAQSCLGRERIFQYMSELHQTPLLIYRLNYANDAGYGVLLEIARMVWEEREINLSMGHINAIWQGDANEMALRCLLHCDYPAKILNITGPEVIAVRKAADFFARIMNKAPRFTGVEQDTALLSNAAHSFQLFGYPLTPLHRMMELQARWLMEGGRLKNKPTHFQERSGKY
ncbi:MAG: epimerase [Chitinophagaceae bacterium]